MALPFFKWSKIAGNNASADPTVNWAEGQPPSSVNDSARAMMASSAAFRDDIAGAILTGGTSTAYTVSSFQVFDNLAIMNGALIAFTPHVANGATVTLNVDGLGNKPLRTSTGVELLASTLIAGTPYMATYNNSDGAWYLHGFYANPYNMPLGAGMDYWGSTAPNSAFVFPTGQAISRTTYAALFALTGTTYGTGDGSTTFNLPDKTGRVSAMKEASATRLTNSGTGNVGIDGGTLGSTGGGSQTLLAANLPPYTPAGTIAVAGNTPFLFSTTGTTAGTVQVTQPSTTLVFNGTSFTTPLTITSQTFSGTAAPGQNSTPVKVAQPTIVCNYIMRII